MFCKQVGFLPEIDWPQYQTHTHHTHTHTQTLTHTHLSHKHASIIDI